MQPGHPRLRAAAITSVLIALPLCLGAVPSASPAAPRAPVVPASPGFVQGEVLIELRASDVPSVRLRLDREGVLPSAVTGIASLDTLGRRFRVRRAETVLSPRAPFRPDVPTRLGSFLRLKLDAGAELEALEGYRADPAVASAQLNYRYEPDQDPNDPQISYAHQKTSAFAGWNIETGDPTIAIAIIGSGVALGHPDLAGNLIAGWDFAQNDPDPSPEGDPHDTGVAGVAAAVTNNGIGVAGACWSCSIMPLRVAFTSVTVAMAIDYARTHGARVVNMSFGSYDPDKYGPDILVETAVNEAFGAGLVLVATAGNDNVETPRYPGALENVIGVAATDENDFRAFFIGGASNFGSWVDVAAPGNNIITTWGETGYSTVDGTSFAAPYVAGLAGLILSRDPSLDPYTVRLIIEYTADTLWFDEPMGSGRINVARALQQTGPPVLFAVIKSPWHDDQLHGGVVPVMGTALGSSYKLEYRREAAFQAYHQIGTGPQTINGTLGLLSLDDLVPGRYRLRLTSYGPNGNVEHEVFFYRTSPTIAGWPVYLNGEIGVPTIADVDGDALPEVLIATNNPCFLHVLRHDGTPLPGWPKLLPFFGRAPSVGDIDGDGDVEIVTTELFSPTVSAWHHNGQPVSGFPWYYSSPVLTFGEPVLAQLDGDPGLEIVAAFEDGAVYVLEAPGGVVKPGWPRFIAGPIPGAPAVGDIDADGALDIVIRSESELHVFKANGTNVTGWPRTSPLGQTAPVVGDLDRDGFLEIVDVTTLELTAWRRDGAVQFWQPGYNSWFVSLADLDGGGGLETLTGFHEIYAYDAQGHLLPGWPAAPLDGSIFESVVADLDGDSQREVGTPQWFGEVFGIDPDGTMLAQRYVWGEGRSAAAVGDLDGDGGTDLVAGGQGWLYAFDLPGVWDPSTAEWPMHRSDPQHTGHYRFADSYADADGDGHANLTDCDPEDPSIHPGGTEACNGIDDDCDGAADEPFDADGDGSAWCSGDCDDSRATVYPGAPEICDGLNNDCTHFAWPNPVAESADADGDSVSACNDCDDSRESVRPGAPQVCGDGLNNDCNNPAWPSLAGTNEADTDGDGYSECAGDCNLASAAVWGMPSEVRDLAFNSSGEIFYWSPPTLPGATTVSYAAVRMGGPAFQDAVCISWSGPLLQRPDETIPPPGGFLYYLVRARNGCAWPQGWGPWGFDSAGGEIVGPFCP